MNKQFCINTCWNPNNIETLGLVWWCFITQQCKDLSMGTWVTAACWHCHQNKAFDLEAFSLPSHNGSIPEPQTKERWNQTKSRSHRCRRGTAWDFDLNDPPHEPLCLGRHERAAGSESGTGRLWGRSCNERDSTKCKMYMKMWNNWMLWILSKQMLFGFDVRTLPLEIHIPKPTEKTNSDQAAIVTFHAWYCDSKGPFPSPVAVRPLSQL